MFRPVFQVKSSQECIECSELMKTREHDAIVRRTVSKVNHHGEIYFRKQENVEVEVENPELYNELDNLVNGDMGMYIKPEIKEEEESNQVQLM